jgi:two-component system response regulator FlrC
VECIAGLYAGAELRDVLRYAEQVAPSDIPLILQGETGTGKEVLARFIHEHSGRPGKFVAVNCAALPESLAEAELFGHSRGAYTGADRARLGHLRAADDGTLLLDEISDLPLAIQAKLLRVLEEAEVTPLGESQPVKVHLRVIAAGQKPLSDLVTAGKFRGDLFARLNGLELRLPALRERREEVPFIFGAVLREAKPGYAPLLQPKLVERLCVYHWPYNVRELVQLTRRIAALYPDQVALMESCLPPHMLGALATDPRHGLESAVYNPQASGGAAPPPNHAAAQRPVAPVPALVSPERAQSPYPYEPAYPVEQSYPREQPAALEQPNLDRTTLPPPAPGHFERLGHAFREQELDALRAALREHGGNVSDAARALGISRQKIYRLIEADPTLDLDAYRRR